MPRHDIERMIAEALGESADEATSSPPRRPLPHGEHILNQYAKLCETEAPPDPSADVELPAAPAPAPAPTRTDRLSSVFKKAIARIKP